MKPSLLKHTWKDFSAKLENLLMEPQNSVVIPLQRQFELQVDFSNMSHDLMKAPDEHVERVVYAFKQMHKFFEAGLLLENHDQTYSTVAFFHKGRIQVAGEEFHQIKLKLPPTRDKQVLATSSQVFMNKLKLNWDMENKCKAYLIRPTPDFAFILFSPVPDLWMQNEIPKMARALENLFPT